MNPKFRELAEQAKMSTYLLAYGLEFNMSIERFAQLIVQECIDKIETHRIPVGNSAAGEMACEWTYAALEEVRDEIKQYFGIDG